MLKKTILTYFSPFITIIMRKNRYIMQNWDVLHKYVM